MRGTTARVVAAAVRRGSQAVRQSGRLRSVRCSERKRARCGEWADGTRLVRRGRKGVMEVRCAEEEDWTVKDMGRWRSVCMVLYELTEMGVS
jgi:hypothetical protein